MHSGVPKMMARHLNSSRDRSKKECQVDEDYCGGGKNHSYFVEANSSACLPYFLDIAFVDTAIVLKFAERPMLAIISV